MEHHLITRPLPRPRPRFHRLVSHRWGRIAAALALAAAAAGAAVTASGASPAGAATTLVVNANQPFRTVTHVASGGLYGLDTATVPADSLVEPLHPNTFVQMAPGGKQLPNGESAPGGDSLVVAPEAAKAGAKVVVRMPDWYPNFPYQWVSWTNWLSAVDTQVKAVVASGDSNISAFELWNEPDWTWNTSAAGAFDAGWARTFKEVRADDSSAVIQGPSYSAWNSGWMSTFLTDAKASGTLPNIISWHELSGQGKIAADVAAYRALEKSLGIGPLPIAIEEYGETSEVGVPGPLAGYIAKFERAGVSNAELAFWNHYGTLGDTLTDTGGSPNAAYWLYRWYGSMTGSMVTTVPPAQTGLDGAASVNSAGNQVSVIFGGGSGSTAVTVNGLSSLSAFGSTAHVVLEQTASAGRTTAVVGPTVISAGNYTISGGSITVAVSSMNAANGYHLLVTPGSTAAFSGSYKIKNVNSGLVLDTSGSGTAQGTAAVQATSSSSTTQSWTLVSRGRQLLRDPEQGERPAARHDQRERHGRRGRAHLGQQRHLRPPVGAGLRGQRRVQDRQLQQRSRARRAERQQVLRRRGPAMDRQRHRRPPVDADGGLTAPAAVPGHHRARDGGRPAS